MNLLKINHVEFTLNDQGRYECSNNLIKPLKPDQLFGILNTHKESVLNINGSAAKNPEFANGFGYMLGRMDNKKAIVLIDRVDILFNNFIYTFYKAHGDSIFNKGEDHECSLIEDEMSSLENAFAIPPDYGITKIDHRFFELIIDLFNIKGCVGIPPDTAKREYYKKVKIKWEESYHPIKVIKDSKNIFLLELVNECWTCRPSCIKLTVDDQFLRQMGIDLINISSQG